MLLDINTGTGISTLHQLTCRAAMTAHTTPAKPFGQLGADGGWFPVVDRAHAMEKLVIWSPGLELTECPVCLMSDVTSA